jgi:hypothetical protein
MNILRAGSLCLVIGSSLAATTMTFATADRAEAAVCPFVMEQYCVKEKGGFKHPAWTNACLAKQQGLRIVNKGLCK